jgi:hypothetical protein
VPFYSQFGAFVTEQVEQLLPQLILPVYFPHCIKACFGWIMPFICRCWLCFVKVGVFLLANRYSNFTSIGSDLSEK